MTKRLSSLTNDEINQCQNTLAKAANAYIAKARDPYTPAFSDQIEDSIDCSYRAKQMDRVIEALNCLRPEEPTKISLLPTRQELEQSSATLKKCIYVYNLLAKDALDDKNLDVIEENLTSTYHLREAEDAISILIKQGH